jgi:hypothetical protein
MVKAIFQVASLSAEAMTEAFEDKGIIEELRLWKESNERKLYAEYGL